MLAPGLLFVKLFLGQCSAPRLSHAVLEKSLKGGYASLGKTRLQGRTNSPSRRIRYAKSVFKFPGGQCAARLGHEPGGLKPHRKRQGRVLEDGPFCRIDVALATGACVAAFCRVAIELSAASAMAAPRVVETLSVQKLQAGSFFSPPRLPLNIARAGTSGLHIWKRVYQRT